MKKLLFVFFVILFLLNLTPVIAECGDGICESGETSCHQDCGYEIYPYDADVDFCYNNKGIKYSTTGPDSASWFIWNSCARDKYYEVTPGEEIRLHVYTDSCSSCVCYFPNFKIYEYENGIWVHKKSFDLPDVKGQNYNEYYTTSSDKIKISATNCFYLDVFSLKGELCIFGICELKDRGTIISIVSLSLIILGIIIFKVKTEYGSVQHRV